jgi:hypothetical protein
VHIKDRAQLTQKVAQQNLTDKVAIQPGADEVSMLLLARAVSDKFRYHPRIKAVYSSDSISKQVMPYEDRPLYKTVSFHLKAVGAIEVDEVQKADIVLYVFASRFQQGQAKIFANEIVDFSTKNPTKGIIVADIDTKGDVQGGDVTFTEFLNNQRVFSKIYGYACWNTAGNTIGTALPHGMVYGASKTIKKSKSEEQYMAKAQAWFVRNRLLDDYAYHAIVRPLANKMSRDNKWNNFRLTDAQTQTIETFCLKELNKYIADFKPVVAISRFAIQKSGPLSPQFEKPISFRLPWNRTFEAEIDF